MTDKTAVQEDVEAAAIHAAVAGLDKAVLTLITSCAARRDRPDGHPLGRDEAGALRSLALHVLMPAVLARLGMLTDPGEYRRLMGGFNDMRKRDGGMTLDALHRLLADITAAVAVPDCAPGPAGAVH